MAIDSAVSVDLRAGKYLTFGLGNEEYGLEILKVREINGIMDITAVPGMPAYVLGVINLRGKVIPVVDMRMKFSMPSIDHTAETCIIVVDVHGKLMSVVVDRVSEVMDINGQDIEDAPDVGAEVSGDYILGMAKTKGRVRILLDIEKVLKEEAPAGAV
jgi:purine-binding chemotaxis protein CheW